MAEVQCPQLGTDEVRLEASVEEDQQQQQEQEPQLEQEQALVPSFEQEAPEDTINKVLRYLRGKGVAQKEEIPSSTPFEPILEEEHHVSPPPIETQRRTQGETSKSANDLMDLMMKQQESLSILQMQVQQVDVKFDLLSEEV
ncbi:hypothetical protein Taro_041063 [Colocasia esculenta]|uniref:Uncharacterized protein n=1 Tax=Colocasia esculenta TaxID=4460 RepID=A0A843WNQ7_COLES|nr:hypothetical protein [Colocasia esculenta]